MSEQMSLRFRLPVSKMESFADDDLIIAMTKGSWWRLYKALEKNIDQIKEDDEVDSVYYVFEQPSPTPA